MEVDGFSWRLRGFSLRLRVVWVQVEVKRSSLGRWRLRVCSLRLRGRGGGVGG